MSKSKFIGEAGEHFVSYQMARNGLYVGLTIGNMPHIDLLVSSGNGLKSISLQVKTSQNAYRKKRYGHEGYEWDVSKSVINVHSTDFWYLLVDLKGDENILPDIYVVPSKWVADFVKPDFSRAIFFLPKKAADLTRNRFDILKKILYDDKETIDWASKWDDDLLVRWGGK